MREEIEVVADIFLKTNEYQLRKKDHLNKDANNDKA